MVLTSQLCPRREHIGFHINFPKYEAYEEKEKVRLNSYQRANIKKMESDSLLWRYNRLAMESQRWKVGGESGPPQKTEAFYH